MANSDTVTLDLTGPQSHRLKMEPGRGNLIVGPTGSKRRRPQPDLVVDPDSPVNWHVFDDMHTGAGSNWPRWIAYEGNDTSLFEWMRERATEGVEFLACRDLDLDLTNVKLTKLTLNPQGHRLRIRLPQTRLGLEIIGDPTLVQLSRANGDTDDLRMGISFSSDSAFNISTLSGLPYLRDMTAISIYCAVLGNDAFDCRSLLECRRLRSLTLYGAMRHLEALARLPLLEVLQLRFVSNLAGLPELSTWPKLRNFVAWNVDEKVGRTLRQSVRRRTISDGEFFSVSQLRSQRWFIEEHGLPFGGWTTKNERTASRAFKAASKLLRDASDTDGAKTAITGFVDVINALSGIETSERDDAGAAVSLLAELRLDLVSVDDANKWFDATRDF